jgi:hypothetical protein
MARVVLGLVVLGLLAGVLLYSGIRGYLHSEGFRRLLSEKAGRAAGVQGSFAPFRWDGLAVESSAFEAKGDGLVRAMRVDDLHTEIGLGGLRRGVWEIRDARARRVEIVMDVIGGAVPGPPQAAAPALEKRERKAPAAGRSKWLPREVELHHLELGEVNVRLGTGDGEAAASGIRMLLEPDGGRGSHRIHATGGTLRMPDGRLPVLRLDETRLRCTEDAVFVTRFSAGVFEAGRIEAAGEWDRQAARYSFSGNLGGVKCAEVLDETWARRLTGDIGSDFSVENYAGRPSAHGRLVVRNATLTALPVLDLLAAYADTRRFRMMALSDARADWKWEDDRLVLSNITLASEGLARLEGMLVIRGRELEGDLRLGLVPGSLASIPGAETNVFRPGSHGLLWAPLRLGGTLDKPREDLSKRLIAAAGLRVLENLPQAGEQVGKLRRELLSGKPGKSAKAVEKGIEILGRAGIGAQEVGGILDSLLGDKKDGKAVPPGQ